MDFILSQQLVLGGGVDFLGRAKNAKACKDENGQGIHKKTKG